MNICNSKPTLKLRILHASSWLFLGYVVSQLLRLGSNLVMTRLLAPEMFGVMALVNVFLVVLSLFTDFGLRQNIVQSKRGDDQVFLNTIWTLQIIRGGVICLVMLCISIAVYLLGTSHLLPEGSAYADPMLPYVMAVLSLNALISGFESTKVATADRNLVIGRLTRIELISQASGIVTMLAWASIDRSIWALVVGAPIAYLIKVMLSHAVLPGAHNTLYLDKKSLREIFTFGKWILLTSVIGVLVNNGDRLLLGAFLDSTTLGIYSIAFFIANSLHMAFAMVIGKVALSALSEVARERPEMLKQAYYKLRAPLDAVSLLSFGLLFSVGHLLIQILYDARYFPAGRMVEILSLALFEVRYSLAGQCFIAMGKTKLMVPIICIRLTVLYGLLPVAYFMYGLDGALWIAGGSVLFTIPMTLYYKVKYGLFNIFLELRGLSWLIIGLTLGWGIKHFT